MFSATTLVFLGLAAVGSSHMIMNTPPPYKVDNSPLLANGADFPCKNTFTGGSGTTSMAIGSVQPLKFTGGATHGGGSCQISVTYDTTITKSSTWKVIHSIEGGCPVQNQAGNIGEDANALDPDTYSFTVPSALPTGTATLAWTWFNKIGNREMYMNCAPISITAGTSKRDEEEDLMARNITQLVERDQAAYNALPNMFVANVGNGCGTQDSKDLLFPNAGDSVETLTGSSTGSLATPTGNCQAAVAGSSPAATATGAGSSAAPSALPAVSASPASSPAASSSLPGGVFATVPTSGQASATAPAVSETPATSAPAAVPTSVASSPVSVPAASPASSASTPAGTGTTGSGTAIAAGTACSPEGLWNCIGGTSFQQCASGTWSVATQMAAGTQCTAGQSTTLNMSASGAKGKRVVGHARRMNAQRY
ncbi:hypothetical protein G7Y89_g11677 [Cudoniella acicularis]|uniref:Chitin-binding type-4 domain-containing protein n=1 Tax=Cudoniella acicularis TaxID=354080 RepID=A0A8H4RBJ7_9HELO|nr:hypothetical protein G7Y89_g11677 [Cudoniella acicularis]